MIVRAGILHRSVRVGFVKHELQDWSRPTDATPNYGASLPYLEVELVGFGHPPSFWLPPAEHAQPCSFLHCLAAVMHPLHSWPFRQMRQHWGRRLSGMHVPGIQLVSSLLRWIPVPAREAALLSAGRRAKVDAQHGFQHARVALVPQGATGP